MASSLLPTEKGEEFKEQFLTCSICYESYDDVEHQAKCLPCLHTFCLPCLKSHIGRRPKFNCPQCRKEITLPGGTVDNLPHNFLVENLKQYQNLINRAVLCGDCDNEQQAMSFCHDCSLFLCHSCVNDHRRKQSQRHHKLSTMQELQQQNCRPKIEQVAVDKINAEIKQFSARVNGKTRQLAKTRETVKTYQNKLTRNSVLIIKEIDQIEKESVNLIKSKCSQATSVVNKLFETEMKSLTSTIEAIDYLTVQMTSACEFANKACDLNHSTQLLTSQHQIKDRLRELEKTDFPETTSGKTDFTFTKSHQSALTQIQESVQHLCDVAWLNDTGIRADHKGTGVKVSCRKNGRNNGQKSAETQRKPHIDPMQCTIRLRLPDTLGFGLAYVQTVDTTGQLLSTGGAKVKATQDGFGTVVVHDNHDGIYAFKYNIYYEQLHVNINGTPMTGSPFTICG